LLVKNELLVFQFVLTLLQPKFRMEKNKSCTHDISKLMKYKADTRNWWSI